MRLMVHIDGVELSFAGECGGTRMVLGQRKCNNPPARTEFFCV